MIFNRQTVNKGDIVVPGIFNDLFSNSSEDIDALSTIIGKISDDISVSVTELKSKSNDIELGIKKLSSTLDAFALYSSLINDNIYGITESFNTTNSVITDSTTVSINTQEGIVTLPQKSVTPIDLSKALISSQNKAGSFADGCGIDKLFDGNDDTYMHFYQKGGNKLVFQFDIKLQSSQVINNIQFTEVNFGQTNWLTLEELSVSSDNQQFHVVASNTILAPENNKFSSGFSFTFLPRKAVYIRCRVSQSNPDITDSTLHIGLNNFTANQILYSDEGTIILKKSIEPCQINSIALHLIDSIFDDVALPVNCQISLDGSTWTNIQPVESANSTKEVISINEPWNNSSVITDVTTFETIYLKMTLSRTNNQDAIVKLVGIDEYDNVEFLQFPSASPYSVQLSQSADKDSISMGIVSGLAAGRKSGNCINFGNTASGTYSYIYDLPFDPKGLEEVYIGDIRLTKVNALNELYDMYEKGYFIDTKKQKLFIYINTVVPTENLVKSGHPWLVINGDGAAYSSTINTAVNSLTQNQPIKMYIKDDILPASSPIPLTLYSDGVKDNFSVWRVSLDANGNTAVGDTTDLIPAGKTIIKLSSIPLSDHPITIVGSSQTDFIDGITEFNNSDWFSYSIDYNKGYLYMRDAYPVDITINYWHNMEVLLDSNDFDISNDGKNITIAAGAYDPKSYYKFEYGILFPVDPSLYSLGSDTKTISLIPKSIIDDFAGLTVLTGKLLKISYMYKDQQSTIVSGIYNYLSQIIPELSIVYSTDI